MLYEIIATFVALNDGMTEPPSAKIFSFMEKDSKQTGLFVGSFDPFTEGHASVVRRALLLFGRLVIGIGINPEKQYMFTAEERRERIARRYVGDPRIEVVVYNGLTVDLAQRIGARFIVKGVRNAADFAYEMRQADYNRKAAGIETLLLPAEEGLIDVSSTRERERLKRELLSKQKQ